MGVSAKAPPEPSRAERLRQALGRSNLEPAITLVVAIAYVVLAYLDGGTEPQFRAGAAIALWVAVILGLVMGLWPRAPVPRPALIAGMCLGGLAAFAGLSMTWANNNEEAFVAILRVLAYLGLFVTVVLASSVGGARPWLTGLTLGLGTVAILAVLSRLQPGLFSAAQTLIAEIPEAGRRLSFPTAYWNGLGASMALGVVLFTWMAADAPGRLARAGATALIAPAVLAMYLTASRGAFVTLAVGLVVLIAAGRPRAGLAASALLGGLAAAVLIALSASVAPAVLDGELVTDEAQRQGDVLTLVLVLVIGGTALVRFVSERVAAHVPIERLGRRTAVAIAVLVGAALAVGAVTGGAAEAASALEERARAACELPERDLQVGSSRLASASGSGRCQYWEVGLAAFTERPIAGLGAGGFEGWWAEHHTFTRPVSFAHSVFVTWLADLGVVGVALIAGFLGVVFAAGLRARSGPGSAPARGAALALLAGGTFSATIDWMWEMPAVFATVIVAAGLLTGPALQPAVEQRRGRFGFGVAALVAGWVTIVAALLSFFGQAKIADSESALERNDLNEAVGAADTASTLEPWAAEPYLLKAAALEAQGNLAGASDAVEAAIDRAPSDFRTWAVAARIEAREGDAFGALDSLARANALNPVVRPLGAPASSPE